MFIKKINIFILFIILILILITDLTIYLALKIKQNKFINNFYLDYSQAELDKKIDAKSENFLQFFNL